MNSRFEFYALSSRKPFSWRAISPCWETSHVKNDKNFCHLSIQDIGGLALRFDGFPLKKAGSLSSEMGGKGGEKCVEKSDRDRLGPKMCKYDGFVEIGRQCNNMNCLICDAI